MDKLLILRDQSLNELQDRLLENIPSYKSEEIWAINFFKNHNWTVESKLLDLPDNLLKIPDEKNDYDSENSKRLFEALSTITLSQASDPRLWTYLTHVKFWKYMRKRWPIDKGSKAEDLSKAIGPLRDRYFLIGDRSRGLTRNGVARLWWAGYTCQYFDEDGQNNFDLAIPLFLKQDVFSSFMERAYSKNKEVMRALLSVLLKKYQEGTPFDDRNKVRALAKYLVMIGGVTILDAMNRDQLLKLIDTQVNKLLSS